MRWSEQWVNEVSLAKVTQHIRNLESSDRRCHENGIWKADAKHSHTHTASRTSMRKKWLQILRIMSDSPYILAFACVYNVRRTYALDNCIRISGQVMTIVQFSIPFLLGHGKMEYIYICRASAKWCVSVSVHIRVLFGSSVSFRVFRIRIYKMPESGCYNFTRTANCELLHYYYY